VRIVAAAAIEASKAFFSEEKKQKTFMSWGSRIDTLQEAKVFRFFSSEKNILKLVPQLSWQLL
jgi:hypothetical protein